MCKHGDTVPMPLNGRVRDIDRCLALLVATLNTVPPLATVACCCGHGQMPPSIILHDDRWLVIMTRAEADAFYAQYPTDIHGTPSPARLSTEGTHL